MAKFPPWLLLLAIDFCGVKESDAPAVLGFLPRHVGADLQEAGARPGTVLAVGGIRRAPRRENEAHPRVRELALVDESPPLSEVPTRVIGARVCRRRAGGSAVLRARGFVMRGPADTVAICSLIATGSTETGNDNVSDGGAVVNGEV